MFPPFTIFEQIVLAVTFLVGVFLVLRLKKETPGRFSILIFGYACIFSALFYLTRLLPGERGRLLLTCILYLIILVLPSAVLLFSLEYLQGRKRPSIYGIVVIVLPPILILFLLINSSVNGYFPGLGGSTGGEILDQMRLLDWFALVYSLGILAAALLVITYTFDFKLTHSQNHPVLVVFIAGILSVIVGIVAAITLVKVPEPAKILLSCLLLGIAFIYIQVANQRNALGRFYGNNVWDHLDEGIIILNEGNQIVAINSAAEQITGETLQGSYGKHIEEIFPDWQRIDQNNATEDGKEFRGTIFINQERRHLGIRVKSLESEKFAARNKMLILRDITELRTANDARQFEREAMGVFLHSLSIAYKDSKTIGEFLERALYQSLYTLNIDSGLIYLLGPASEVKRKNFSLEAGHGILGEKESLLFKAIPFELLATAEGRLETLIIPDVKHDEVFARFFDDSDGFSLAFSPLVIQQEILGMLVLGRRQVDGFSQQDLPRLDSAANEIASFVHKQRFEQQQIAYEERLRLVRDLHDSITQKLYGLVTISEAVKVGLAAGATEKALNLMPRVSENARQALREMRLFLHELDPVDLEKEGLVSALHQRLTAVEGRSDVKARLISQGEFSFSREKERAMYYVAEEALNNILKHAQVKSVSVKLYRRGKRVYLDIIDDGCGFDPAAVQSGGRGLRNMKERAAQIGATFKITSGKNKGTKVSLSFQE